MDEIPEEFGFIFMTNLNIPLSLMNSSESLASAGSLCRSLPSFSSRYLFDIRARRDLSNDLLGKIRSRHV